MSEAKPQDGSTATGYRTLSHGEVGKMNQFKEISRQFIRLLREHSAATHTEIMSPDERFEAMEWIRQADMLMKQACMAACRSVTKPDIDC